MSILVLMTSLDEMAHFFFVFAILFVVLAFVGHWQFASMLPEEFGTMGKAFEWQFMMIIGEFPFDGWRELGDSTQMMMYWVYLILFAVVMFLTMMNFFLAIIVDAFVAVKQDIEVLSIF